VGATGVWGAVTQTEGGVAGMLTRFGAEGGGGGGGGGGGAVLPELRGGGGGGGVPPAGSLVDR